MPPNNRHRRELLKRTPSNDGIPVYLLSTNVILTKAFPDGMTIDSSDYCAIWSFLDNEGFSFRAIATALDFAFDLGYGEVLNAYAVIEDEELRLQEMKRVEQLMRPYGLDAWRKEAG